MFGPGTAMITDCPERQKPGARQTLPGLGRAPFSEEAELCANATYPKWPLLRAVD